ncbi:methylmalonyl-CoA mutase family protein [Lutibacter citreus]|uniref:methylmalonyl-CoA mutase family protein n=1 Tax=Lutibacter citreus TaxID=2138210 RepID=UPI000DBE2649|nr:methylmalonyl-CoA mutase family protein [Lutibacter citreus]
MSDFYFNDFPSSSSATWKQKIQFELKGADYNQTLLTKTIEGITIKPFYHIDSFEKLDIPTINSQIKICEKIVIDSDKEANLKALKAINNGASSLKFISTKSFNITTVFEKLINKNIDFHLQLSFLDEDFINELICKLKNESVFYNIDIIGNLAKTGNWFNSLNSDFKSIEKLIEKNPTNYILSVNSNTYQNGGANIVQQVAYSLAHANEYLLKFGSDVASKIQFNFATGGNFFFEIAKIRAFRHLFNLILEKYNTSSVATIFSEPTYRNKTKLDLKTNIIRATTENFSAILGGTNTISAFSFNELYNLKTELSENVSKNQLLVLKEKLQIKNQNEISNNSYFIESLTVQIAEKALEIFKDIENSGGFLKQLKEGTIQRKIIENAKKEQFLYNSEELVLTDIYKNKKNTTTKPSNIKNQYKTLISPILAKRIHQD